MGERMSNDRGGAVRESAATTDFDKRDDELGNAGTAIESNRSEVNLVSETGYSRVFRVCSMRLMPVFIGIRGGRMPYSIRCLKICTF